MPNLRSLHNLSFAIRECRMGVMVPKPHDVYLALKIVAAWSDRPPYSLLAAELAIREPKDLR